MLPLYSEHRGNWVRLSNSTKPDCIGLHRSCVKEIMFMADIKAEYLACPIRQVVSRFGDKWSMLVLFSLYRNETGVLRFNEIRRLMTDCSQKMLSQTLKSLEQSHLVHREVFPEVPPRVEYSLTDTGKSLMPTINALIDWGKEHFGDVVTD